MSYQVLNPQELFVLSGVYCSDEQFALRRASPKFILNKVHCCPDCKCSYLTTVAKVDFAQRVKAAEMSGQFKHVFVSWNYDKSCLALFGEFSYNPDTSSPQFALLGEWEVSGTLPTYEERLAWVRDRYRSFWPARVVVGFLLGVGVVFLLNALASPSASFEANINWVYTSLFGTVGLFSAYQSLKKRRLLGIQA